MQTTTRRHHPLVLGTIIAAVALVAAVGAATAWDALDDDEASQPVDATLRFTPDDQDPTPLVADDATGTPVPTASFPRLDGSLASLADYRGTPLVVNFFGSWCVPCRKEVPDIEAVHQELGDDVAFLGLAVNDSARDAAEFVEKYGATYDIARDPSGKLFSEFGGVNMPSTFLVSADGKVVAARAGAIDADALRQLIAKHLR